MDAILNVVASSWGVTILMAAISLFLGGKVKKYKKLIKEILEVGIKYRQITSAKSVGGKNMTKAEKDDFVKEIVDVLQAGAGLIIPAKKTPTI